MANRETATMKSIMLALGNGVIRVFRNNVGQGELVRGGYVKFGLHKGAGDLLGWKSIEITPDMVGKRAAIFLSIEVKEPGGKTNKERAEEQENWRRQILNAGGIAGVARSVDDAMQIVGRS